MNKRNNCRDLRKKVVYYKNLFLESIFKKGKNCVKLSIFFKIFNFNSMRKLFWTCNQLINLNNVWKLQIICLRSYDFCAICAIVCNFIIFTRSTPIYQYFFYTPSETAERISSKFLMQISNFIPQNILNF